MSDPRRTSKKSPDDIKKKKKRVFSEIYMHTKFQKNYSDNSGRAF